MEIAAYAFIMVTLLIFSKKINTKPILRHGCYTRLIQPGVYGICIKIMRGKTSPNTGKLIFLYGSGGSVNLNILHLSVKISSFLIFLIFPTLISTFVKIGFVEGIISIALPVIGYILPSIDLASQIKKRRRDIMMDFPVFCTDLAIMAGAGLGLRESWERASRKKTKSEFYKEARLVILRNNAGISFVDAIYGFSSKLAVPEVHTFAAVVSQAVKEGGNTTQMLKECAMKSWEAREGEAEKKAEEAVAKIVFPLVLGLAGILLILAAPAILMMKGV